MIRHVAAVCFGLWVAISCQVLAQSTTNKDTAEYDGFVVVPVDECFEISRLLMNKTRVVFPHATNPQCHYMLGEEDVYQFCYKNRRPHSYLGCYKAERIK